ncbi:MAG: sulfatase-like hydrolase/transferase [Kofleriaceae bacterium]
MSATADAAESKVMRPGPASIAIYLASIAVAYSLLPITSGMSVAFSLVDVGSVVVFWSVIGAALGFALRKYRRAWLEERTLHAWAVITTGWALTEALFTVVVVVKPTRWPPLPYTAVGMGVPAIIASVLGVVALRRAARGQRVRGVHPALVMLASWSGLAALLQWLPRWLRGLSDTRSGGWLVWGAFDLLWIALAVAAVVMVGAGMLAVGRRRQIAYGAGGVLAALQLLPLAVTGASAAAPAIKAPSVVWIMIDSMRVDHVSAYGYPRPTMPNLERLAGEGTLVRSHVSTGTRTENTYAKMLSLTDTLDRFVPETAVPLSSARALLPQGAASDQAGIVTSLHDAGYQTALFHVYHDLLEDRGLQPWLQGFDEFSRTRLSGDASVGAYFMRMVFGDRLDGKPRMDRWAQYRRSYLAQHVTTEVQDFLDQRAADRPLFMIVHLAGGHPPYYRFGASALPDPQPAGAAGQYDRSLRAADEQLAALVAMVKARLPGAVTFVFADHGVQLPNEPKMPQHLNVPLVVTPALSPPPSGVTSSLDIVATTLALARGHAARCDGPLARDLRCPGKLGEIRVVDHTGHGELMFAAMFDSDLVGVDVGTRKVEIGSLGGAPVTACEFFKWSELSVQDLRISPLETREALSARLTKQLSGCARQ